MAAVSELNSLAWSRARDLVYQARVPTPVFVPVIASRISSSAAKVQFAPVGDMVFFSPAAFPTACVIVFAVGADPPFVRVAIAVPTATVPADCEARTPVIEAKSHS